MNNNKTRVYVIRAGCQTTRYGVRAPGCTNRDIRDCRAAERDGIPHLNCDDYYDLGEALLDAQHVAKRYAARNKAAVNYRRRQHPAHALQLGIIPTVEAHRLLKQAIAPGRDKASQGSTTAP